jgi:threonine/homoserine/homoserine lactone efflux protein
MTGFLFASLILVVIPGPDQALVTRNRLGAGRRAGLATMLGGASGLGVHATAAAFGISALIASSPAAFAALKLGGIVYLLFLGIETWRNLGPGESARSGRIRQRACHMSRPFTERRRYAVKRSHL